VICANQRPDHTTIARFRQRQETALAGLFGEVLALCAEAGLVRVGVIAVDGTKVHANASERATRSYEEIPREILEDAAAVDTQEDERFGDARGDELPGELATGQGRQRWLRDAKRRLDERRAQEAKPIPMSRPDRLKEAKRRLEEEHRVECRANAAYEDYRRHGRMRNGRRLGAHSPPKPYQPPERPEGTINLTDPDSRNVKTPQGWVQGYNAQAVTTEDQIVIAAEVHVSSADFGQLEPMVAAARCELARAGVEQPPEAVLADARLSQKSTAARRECRLPCDPAASGPRPPVATSNGACRTPSACAVRPRRQWAPDRVASGSTTAPIRVTRQRSGTRASHTDQA
jgi:hypothetical protein